MDYGMYYESLIRELEVYAVNPEVTHANADILYGAIDAIKSLKADADRYEFLKSQFRVMSLDMGGNHTWVLRSSGSLKGYNLDDAVDNLKKGQND